MKDEQEEAADDGEEMDENAPADCHMDPMPLVTPTEQTFHTFGMNRKNP